MRSQCSKGSAAENSRLRATYFLGDTLDAKWCHSPILYVCTGLSPGVAR